MKNNKWKFLGIIGQVHDMDAKSLVFETKEITDKSVVKNVVDMHNEGKSLREIDNYLLDEGACTQEEREFIVEAIHNYFETEYEFRAVMPDGDGVRSIPLEHVNVDERHDVVAIGLYRTLNDGTQEHIRDIDHRTIKQWNAIFMGFRYGDAR